MRFFRSAPTSSRRNKKHVETGDSPTSSFVKNNGNTKPVRNSKVGGLEKEMSCLTVDTTTSAGSNGGTPTLTDASSKQQVVVVQPQETKEIKTAKAFFDAIAKADMEELKKVTHEDCRMLFGDGVEINPANIAEETIKLRNSFPDSYFVYQEVYHKEPNVVYLKLYWVGTHTGPAYGFGPYEEVPTSGINVVNDPEVIHFTLHEGRGIKINVEPTGPNTGFHGVYQAIGGLII